MEGPSTPAGAGGGAVRHEAVYCDLCGGAMEASAFMGRVVYVLESQPGIRMAQEAGPPEFLDFHTECLARLRQRPKLLPSR